MGFWQHRLLKCTLWGLVQMHLVSTVCSAGRLLYDATTLFSWSSFMHQYCSGVLSGWHIQSVKMHLCRINIVRSAANTATPYILYASTVCCADKTEGTQTKSYASTMTIVLLLLLLLLRRARCWQTQHLCTKLELNLVQSAPPLWLINNAGLLESTMWEDAFLPPASTLWGLVHQLQPFYASTFRRLVRAPTTHCDWCVLKNFLLFIMFIRFG